jgi:hypothetical protein
MTVPAGPDERDRPTLSTHRDTRLPNLFVIGAPKCGTTSLHAALAQAPTAYMSRVKEPGFFSSDRQFARGVKYYLDSYFKGANDYSVRGESTPWYLYSAAARRRIADVVGPTGARIVILLRNPADRAYSMYLDQHRIGNEERRFRDAVEEEMKQIESGNLNPDIRRRYIWGGQYAPHVTAWVDTFGRDRICIILTDDLRDSASTWGLLSTFLGQNLGDDKLGQLSQRERNVAGALRWPRLDRALRALEGHDSHLLRGLQRALPHGWDRRFLQAVFTSNHVKRPSPIPPPPESVMRSLDEYFRGDVIELQRILYRPLTSWLPEHIARG